MAVIENSVVRSIGAFELVQALGDQKATDAIAGHEGKLALKKVEAPESCELIKHQKKFLPPLIDIQTLGQSASDLVEHEPHQGLGASDVGRWHHKVERDGPQSVYEIANAPVTSASDLGDDRIAVESQETHRGR